VISGSLRVQRRRGTIKPEAVFMLDAKEVTAREHCNLHGLWKDK
jgi:desulfoferrodoxin (superoxide reductase-like protein)